MLRLVALPRGPTALGHPTNETCLWGPRYGRSLRDLYTCFAVGLPLVGAKMGCKRSTGAPPRREYTRHEVTATRVGRPSGSVGLT